MLGITHQQDFTNFLQLSCLHLIMLFTGCQLHQPWHFPHFQCAAPHFPNVFWHPFPSSVLPTGAVMGGHQGHISDEPMRAPWLLSQPPITPTAFITPKRKQALNFTKNHTSLTLMEETH